MLGHINGRYSPLAVSLDNMASRTPFARFYVSPQLQLPVVIELPNSFDSLLAALIADGYDLAALQPFLAG